MNNFQYYLLSMVVIFTAVIVGSLIDKKFDTENTEKPTPTVVIEIPQWETSFLKSCKTTPLNKAYCDCFLKYLKDNYTTEELRRSEDLTEKQTEEFLAPAMNKCIDLYVTSPADSS